MADMKPGDLHDAVIEAVAAALHEDLCGCRKPHRLHGRTYMELSHTAVTAALAATATFRLEHPEEVS